MSQQITINEQMLTSGFEMARSYEHDQYVTFLFKRANSNFYIEATYEGSEMVSCEVWCNECEKINPNTITLLAQFLNANNL